MRTSAVSSCGASADTNDRCACAVCRTLLYAELVNADLQSAIEGHEARKLQWEGRWNVRHANTQTQPIHFARA